MGRRIESLFLAGPAGRLEAIIEEPEEQDPIEAVVICHPHPLGGGTMHNKVVHRLARGLRKTGCVILRFNFRGVNLSDGKHDQGIGEVDDARTALHTLRERYPALPSSIAGFSFGSRIALRIAANDIGLRRVIAVGFPTKYPDSDYVREVSIPKFFLQSTHDEFGPRPDFQAFYDTLPEPKQLVWIDASDHFFKDALDAYEAEVIKIGWQR